jgi:hypothetical protein
MIWLDAWAVAFFLVVALLWNSGLRRNVKFILSIGCLSVFGMVAIALIFDGTPFGMNAYWGDQKFRIAMIQKFIHFGWFTDFYYRDLAPFYPPVYYFLLSLYARIFSVDAYKMLKVGGMLTFMFGPILLYFFWKKMVSSFQAFFITIAGFLFCTTTIHFQFFSPHAYPANLFFVPWWLYYVEQVKNPGADWRYYLFGGLIGGLIFMTYFYAFFIGLLLLVLRMVFLRSWPFIKDANHFKAGRAFGILLSTAVFSVPYWLPLLMSVAALGVDRSRGGWHHIGSPGLHYQYLEFSLQGLLFVAAILYFVRRKHVPLNRGLLLIIIASVVLHLVASVFGAVGISLNLVKSEYFIGMIAGAYIGLFLAGLVRWEALKRKRMRVFLILSCFLTLFFLNSFINLARHPQAKTARTTIVPDWKTDPVEMKARTGSVFLCASIDFFSFHPVYTFIAINEHYSHPASRFKQRFFFLNLLQRFNDPYIFYLGLQYNKFDKVDYFMPWRKGNNYEIFVSISNYPNGTLLKTTTFKTSIVNDRNLFVKEKGDELYSLSLLPDDWPDRKYNFEGLDLHDSLRFITDTKMLRSQLDVGGKKYLDSYVDMGDADHEKTTYAEKRHTFAGLISIMDERIADTGDSVYFILTFLAEEDITEDYKVFLHLYDNTGQFYNFDFIPDNPTGSWKKWNMVTCLRAVPKVSEKFKYTYGFFSGRGQLGIPRNGAFQPAEKR